jgi:superfamily II DNA or RNA helicase
MSVPPVNPGDRVVARDQTWRVRTVQEVAGGLSVVELDSLDRAQPARATLVVPPDVLTPLPPESPRFDLASLTPWHAWTVGHRIIAATLLRESSALSGALHGRVALEAYQLAPALRLLSHPKPSLLIADDVGLGKTIEAGLALLELAARGRAERVLIVTPPGLLQQWQQELKEKLGLDFVIVENASGLARVMTDLPAGISPWDALPRVLTSIDYIKKETIRRRALRKRWDLIIVDEAHALALAGSPRNPYETQRTRLGTALRDSTRGLLLLTATPHNGYGHNFRSLLELVEPTGASLQGDREALQRRVGRSMVRRMKAQITRRLPDGSEEPVFPPRHVSALPVTDTQGYAAVLAKVATYCARTAKEAAGTDTEDLVTFAMQIIKKRALSSRRALSETLEHRLKALRKEEERETAPARVELRELQADLPLGDAQAERIARQVLRSAIPIEERRRKVELSALNGIRTMMRKLPDADPKIEALVGELERAVGEAGEKVIVFTEYLDTLEAIKQRLEGSPLAGKAVVMRGGLTARQRLRVQDDFEKPAVRLLLATDAASEGLNLQRLCRRVVHVELPWNPNRLEQRNGRIDRYGQTREPIIRYLYYPDSPEDDVLHQLAAKIETMRSDRVSTPDVLGVISGAEEIGRGLVDLDPSSPTAAASARSLVTLFEDRTAEFVRNVQPLLAVGDSQAREIADIGRWLATATPLAADDERFERLVQAVLGARMQPLDGSRGLWRIEVPLDLRGPGVEASYPAATFRRSVAVSTRSDEVEYVTPAHPLARAMADQARRRLLQVYPDERGLPPQRLAARRTPRGTPPAAVFTFLGAVGGGDGASEERLLAVRVGLDGTSSIGAADAAVVLSDEHPAGEVPSVVVERLFAPAFDRLAGEARAAAESELRRAAHALRERRAEQAALLRRELETDLADRLRELDEEEKRATGRIDDSGQQRLFAEDPRAGAAYRAQRAMIDTHRQQRLAELARFEQVDDPLPPRPMGVAFLVPEEL